MTRTAKLTRIQRKQRRVSQNEADRRIDHNVGLARKKRDEDCRKANQKYKETVKAAADLRTLERATAEEEYEAIRVKIYKGEES